MSYVTEDSLKRYAEKEKEWCDRQFTSVNDLNWQRTEKAGAVTCYPVGESPLEGTVEFKFKEILPAEGEKGLNNPSIITGVENIIVGKCGKNLYNIFGTPESLSLLPEPDVDGYINFSSTNTSESVKYYSRFQKEKSYILSEKTYTVVLEVDSISSCAILLNMNSEYAQRGQLNTGYKWISSAGTHFIVCTNNNIYEPNVLLRLVLSVLPNTTASIKFRVSVFEGIVDSSNFEYVPYLGTDYTISLGSTYYGGSIDLKTGLMTVTTESLLLDNTYEFGNTSGYFKEFDNYYSIVFYPGFGPYKTGYNIPLEFTSDKLPIVYLSSTAVPDKNCFYLGSNSRGINLCISKTDLSLENGESINTVRTAMLNWLTSNSIRIIYPLEIPQTIQLTPFQILSLPLLDKCTPRVNTLYTDAESIQVGYAKHPSRTAYELQQAITAIGG